LFIGHGNFLRRNAQQGYLIILATVFNLLRQHKMQTEYIFVFIKEWHEKAPDSGAERLARALAEFARLAGKTRRQAVTMEGALIHRGLFRMFFAHMLQISLIVVHAHH
jgi:hypothetical protein